MVEVSLNLVVRESSAERCDQLASHILRASLPKGTIARVISRVAQELDVTPMGAKLPQTTTGMVTTEYSVESDRFPKVDGQTLGIQDL